VSPYHSFAKVIAAPVANERVFWSNGRDDWSWPVTATPPRRPNGWCPSEAVGQVAPVTGNQRPI
jgi:hypothetical protein